MHPEQMAFEAAIRKNWDDDELRLVFSDWLVDHDQPEEAERMRRWPEVREQSKKWLEDFAHAWRERDETAA